LERIDYLKNVKRIVVKIGTSTITVDDKISTEKIKKIVDDTAFLMKSGIQVILVSSGAISAGAGVLNFSRNHLTIPERQALAAIGQTQLMDKYRECFEEKNIHVGQMLLTEDDIRNRRRFLNARNTVNALLDLNVVPIINENDSVAVKEIKIGDNDTLSAHVLTLIEGDLLILLSDINGFYYDLKDPEPIYEIFRIDDDLRKRAGGAGTAHGTGGMITKINAAEMIMRFGGKMIIADGKEPDIIKRIVSGERVGSLFTGENRRFNSRKKWISLRKARGAIIIDDGAVKALITGKKSLLATGVTGVEGKFDMGDIIEIMNLKGESLAKGIVHYNSSELDLIKGKRTDQIKSILGIKYFDEVINRDDLFILNHNPDILK
jgi:glutamate 5-kinase